MPVDFPNIEPVNPRFFNAVTQDPLLSGSAKAAIVDRALEGRLSLEAVRSKLVGSRQTERLNNLRIEREELALSEARRVARDRQAATDAAGGFRDSVRGVLDNPEFDNDQKHEALGRLQFEHSEIVSQSPALQRILGSAQKTLPPRLTAAGKLALERERRITAGMAFEAERRQQEAGIKAFNAAVKERKGEVQSLFDGVKGAKFKELETATGTETLDEFENSAVRHEALAFVEQVGGDVAAAEGLTDRELVDLTGRLYRRWVSSSPATGGGGKPNSAVDSLNIPRE